MAAATKTALIVIAAIVAAFVIGSIVQNVLVSVGLIVVGAAIGVALMWRVISAKRAWHDAELHLPSAYLSLGELAPVVYRREARNPSDIASATATFTLECTEHATYQSGSNRRTATKTVCERRFTGSCVGTAAGIEATATIGIPLDDGGPSMDLGNNRLLWQVEVRLDGEGFPSDTQRFPITVSASVHPDARHQVHDT